MSYIYKISLNYDTQKKALIGSAFNSCIMHDDAALCWEFDRICSLFKKDVLPKLHFLAINIVVDSSIQIINKGPNKSQQTNTSNHTCQITL